MTSHSFVHDGLRISGLISLLIAGWDLKAGTAIARKTAPQTNGNPKTQPNGQYWHVFITGPRSKICRDEYL